MRENGGETEGKTRGKTGEKTEFWWLREIVLSETFEWDIRSNLYNASRSPLIWRHETLFLLAKKDEGGQ
jgi:hypothetical protein